MKAKPIEFLELVELVGERNALKLCKYYGGRRLPTPLQYLRAKRDNALFKDYMQGAQIGELAAKFELPSAVVRAKITKRLKEIRANADLGKSSS